MIPSLAVPEYQVKLFSQSKSIRVRPYLVGEEKILLIAQQGEDPTEIKNAVKQVLRACTFDLVEVDKLPSFDLEYLYLQLRSKSVNNIVTVNYKCRNTVPDLDLAKVALTETKECGALVPVEINLDDLAIKETPGHTKLIWLNDQVGITLRYPTKEILDEVESTNGVFGIDLLTRCIETIFTKAGDVTEVDDVEAVEIMKFVDSLSLPQFEMIQKFFNTMPRLSYVVNFKCPACAYEQEMTIEGLMDFFV